MSEDKKTSIKDIADSSKTSLKELAANVYTKEFSVSEIVTKILVFAAIFFLLGHILKTDNSNGTCLIGGLDKHEFGLYCYCDSVCSKSERGRRYNR